MIWRLSADGLSLRIEPGLGILFPRDQRQAHQLIDDIGVETMVWGSDYPHTDGIWPESSKYIEEQFAGVSPDVVHKITCENAAKFYGLID